LDIFVACQIISAPPLGGAFTPENSSFQTKIVIYSQQFLFKKKRENKK
jgi:hypothetical protein